MKKQGDVKERPILMNAEMVRATLADRKTQTRRVVTGKAQWVTDLIHNLDSISPKQICPY